MNNSKPCVINSFVLKIIALVTMTFDHVGMLLSLFISENNALYITFRSIGRLALPLFCFMIVEGVIHTKSFPKYILKLGILLVIISISLIILKNTNILSQTSYGGFGNIYIDLLLGALAVYLLRKDKPYLKLLAILPLIYSIVSFIVVSLEDSQGIIIHWFPYFLRCQNGFFGVSLIIGFYLAYILKDLVIKSLSEKMNVNDEVVVKMYNFRLITNAFSFIILFTLTLLFILLSSISGFILLPVQFLCILSGVFILFYNGERGYNKKWFNIFSYAYYPLHILILGIIYFVISL